MQKVVLTKRPATALAQILTLDSSDVSDLKKFDVKRTCFVGVLQLVLHLVCCYILASRTFNLNNKCCWFQKKQDSMCFSFQLHRHVVLLLAVNNSFFHIHETHVCLRFCICTYTHPVPHGTLSFE